MIPNLTWGADFGGLVDYLVENRDHEVLDLQGVSSISFAAAEMAAVADLSDRAKNKLLHLSLSAAHQDGVLKGEQWLNAVNRLEMAYGLQGHQRVIVRHKDKTHDHVHVFWCTISLETGRTPADRWFLKKGFGQPNIGPRALTEQECGLIPAAQRGHRSYDFRLLARSQHLCRELEREFSLRQLRSPQQAATARLSGEQKAPSAAQKKRAERTGSTPLITRAEEIRAMLDTPDWQSKLQALATIGISFEPVTRTTKKGLELRGLVIFDAADPGNRIRASELDTTAQKFGLRQLDARHDCGAARFEEWWPMREYEAPSRPLMREDGASRLKASFELLCGHHRLVEMEKAEKLRELRRKQAKERAAKRLALMKRRRNEASKKPQAERRAFYSEFSRSARAVEMSALEITHKLEAAALSRARKPAWLEYLSMCAAAGDVEAAELVSKRSKVALTPERELAQSQVPTPLVSREQVRSTVGSDYLAERATSVGTPVRELSPDELLQAYKASRGMDR